MNLSLREAKDLAIAIGKEAKDLAVEVGVAPPFPFLAAVKAAVGPAVKLVAQNCSAQPSGAFTGEVSVSMLADVGCDYVLVGHSERRQLFNETDEAVNRKVLAVREAGLSVILAVGETLQEREAETTRTVVERQLELGLRGLSNLEGIVVAYEPVWAIGTGKTATPEQAQEVHGWLREKLASRFGTAAQGARIQYGGSMKPANAAELLQKPDIDGGLVGGASLQAESFLSICRAG